MSIKKAIFDRTTNILKQQANKRELITYQMLNKKLSPDGNGPFFDDITELFKYLTKVSRTMHIRRRPLLTVIVVDEGRDQPGSGFFKLAKELGVFKEDISSKIEKEKFFKRELEKVFSYNW